MPASRNSINLAGAAESIISSTTLPEGNGLSINELGILIMEGLGLKEHVRGRAELREHHDVLEVLRGKPRLPADIEEGTHTSKTISIERHSVSRIPDELRIENSLTCVKALAILGVETGEKVDRLRAASTSNSTTIELVIHSLNDHVIDSAHDKGIVAQGERLFYLIKEHRNKGIELGCRREALLDLTLGDRTVDLKRSHFVEELCFGLRLMENIGVIAGAVSQLPIFRLNSFGHFRANLFYNRPILPRIHEDRRGRATVGPVDEDNFADAVHERTNEFVKRFSIEDCGSHVNDIGKVFGKNSSFTDRLLSRIIHELIYLRYFHCLAPFCGIDST